MKAKVKRIKIGTELDVDGHSDSFVDSMYAMYKSGDAFEFTPHFTQGINPKWFECVDRFSSYTFHISWLKDIQE